MKRLVEVICTQCDRVWVREIDEEELKYDYTRQHDGIYRYDRGDCWCDQCEEEDMRCITRDYYPPNFRGHKI